MKMKKGVCLTAIFPDTIYNKQLLLQKIMKVYKESDFECIELYFDGNENDYKEIGGYLKEKKLSSIFLAGYPLKEKKYDLSSENNEKREQAVLFCSGLYKKAKLLGAEKMLVLSGPKWQSENADKLVEQMTKSLAELHNLWKKGYPEITLEFFNDLGEPFLAVGNLKITKRVFESFSEEGLGITFDTSHAAQLNENIWTAYIFLEQWIHHLHLANSVSKFPESALFGDKHPLFGQELSDFSSLDMADFIRRIRGRSSFKKIDVCSVEVISRTDAAEEWYWRQIVNQVKEIW